jgi:diguanylate cyclase (GGDEF)-like protein
MPATHLRFERQPVPRRALAISAASLAIPVAAAVWLPDWTSNGIGMLVWLSALIPAFLLAYYRGLVGVAVALAGGMAVITATQVSVVMFDIAEPNWLLLGAVVAVYLVVSLGIGVLAELLRRERRAAEAMALMDQLTEIPNRRFAEKVLEREFAAAERGRDLTVVVFDLDHFKRVNDAHGHSAGDATLKAFAAILQANTRKEDLSGRIGGEEFVSVLRDTTTEEATFFAQRVLKQLREHAFSWGTQTVSAGVAAHEHGMGSHELLLSAADRALYQAKDSGRDRVFVAPRLAQTASNRMSMTGAPAPAPARPVEGKVYVVDDDEGVRSALKRILARSGYEIWDTGNPLEAIRHFAEASTAERPDVILTDVIMPEMTGMRMIDQISQVSSSLRVIYMSGHVQSKISWAGTPGEIVMFLEKPIEMDTLLAAVHGVMHGEIPQTAAAE